MGSSVQGMVKERNSHVRGNSQHEACSYSNSFSSDCTVKIIGLMEDKKRTVHTANPAISAYYSSQSIRCSESCRIFSIHCARCITSLHTSSFLDVLASIQDPCFGFEIASFSGGQVFTRRVLRHVDNISLKRTSLRNLGIFRRMPETPGFTYHPPHDTPPMHTSFALLFWGFRGLGLMWFTVLPICASRPLRRELPEKTPNPITYRTPLSCFYPASPRQPQLS